MSIGSSLIEVTGVVTGPDFVRWHLSMEAGSEGAILDLEGVERELTEVFEAIPSEDMDDEIWGLLEEGDLLDLEELFDAFDEEELEWFEEDGPICLLPASVKRIAAGLPAPDVFAEACEEVLGDASMLSHAYEELCMFFRQAAQGGSAVARCFS